MDFFFYILLRRHFGENDHSYYFDTCISLSGHKGFEQSAIFRAKDWENGHMTAKNVHVLRNS